MRQNFCFQIEVAPFDHCISRSECGRHFHLPNEKVQVLVVIRNVDRTLLKVRWQSGGEWVVFSDDLNENRRVASCERGCGKTEEHAVVADVMRFGTELYQDFHATWVNPEAR